MGLVLAVAMAFVGGTSLGVSADHGCPWSIQVIGEALTADRDHRSAFAADGGMEFRGKYLSLCCGLVLLGHPRGPTDIYGSFLAEATSDVKLDLPWRVP